MADPGDKKKCATYQDVLDAPEHMVAEIINGEVHLSPRPGGAHTRAASVLGFTLGTPFDRGKGGPGGWIILVEPELHLGDDIVVPDLAAWRRDRLEPAAFDAPYFTIAPDWICEMLSKSTERFDRLEKMPLYAAAGVQYAWLVSALRGSLEVFRLHEGKWLSIASHLGRKTVRAEPFDAIELDISELWEDLPPPGSRACEAPGGYEYEPY